MLSDVFWWTSYILAFLGSISFGYLTIRYSIPDIRETQNRLKLAFAGLVGMIFFVPSVILSFFISRPLLFVGLPVFTLLTCFAFTLKNTVFVPKTMKVALPVVSAPRKKPVELKCLNCKAEYNEGDFYCGKCGAKL